MLHDKYPHISVLGDNYPPPTWKQFSASALGILKIIVIMLVAAGMNVFTWLGQATPRAYQWMLDNKLYASVMLFFVSNAIEGQLISTGAFEIQFNDVPVWSKLETGRIPQPPELFQIIENHIRLDQTPQWSDSL